MITIAFDGFLKRQAYLTDLEYQLTDRTRLFSDFIAPLVAGEIAEVFETDGGRLDENIEKLTEKWAREEIAEVERRLF